ncbi:MAG TPA: hypothetical protein VIH99_12510 [Bdellovibrionota bacterium]|jgi:hypothetical protein
MRLSHLLLAGIFLAAELIRPAFANQFGSALSAGTGAANAANMASMLGTESIARGERHIKEGRAEKDEPKVRKGSFEVLQGLLGLLAAAAAAGMAAKDQSNAGKLSNMAGSSWASTGPAANGVYSPASGVTSGSGPSSASEEGSTGSHKISDGVSSTGEASQITSVAFEQLESADPSVKKAVSLLKKEYGITSEQILSTFAKGGDGQDLFVAATENPMTTAQAKSAYKASLEDIKAVRENKDLNAAEAGTPGTAGIAASDNSSDEYRVAVGTSRPSAQHLRNEMRRKLSEADEESVEVSPELQRALDAKAREELQRERWKNSLAELSLFESVHKHYRQREFFLRFGAPIRSEGENYR